jgi:putative tricarboxylic transport membrane protein
MATRRSLIKAGLGASVLGLGLSRADFAQAQALSNLDIFVPAAPGGGWDQTGRSIEAVLRADGLVKEFKFEHAPGAGGAVGLPKFLNSRRGRGDALMIGGMVMIGAVIANKSPVKISDTTPIARLTGEAEVVVVPAESPFKSLGDLVKALKADPKKVSIAGGSAGGTDHIFAGMIARAVGVDPRQVAYVAYAGGGPAQAALLGNQVSAGISGYGEFEAQIKAGKLRAIAISSAARESGINVPTVKEQGVDVVLYNWRGVFGAPGITPAQRTALVNLIETMAKGKNWKAELEKKGWTDILLTGDAYSKYVNEEIVRITGILKDLGLAA